jgi:hypothetical protein
MKVKEASVGLYSTFKFLNSLNKVEIDFKLEINDLDMSIMKAHYDLIKYKIDLDFNRYLEIIKNVSLEYMRTPVVVSNITYQLLKNK